MHYCITPRAASMEMLKTRRRCHLVSILCSLVVYFMFADGGTATMRLVSTGMPSFCHHAAPSCSLSSMLRRRRVSVRNGRATTTMSSLRSFDPSELQLQRYIGELGFVEITDWCVWYHAWSVAPAYYDFPCCNFLEAQPSNLCGIKRPETRTQLLTF